ncbi:hypothetical protein NLJ89_g3461 [Agrocybe chaxingu]|uniref:DNA polymerase II subunit 2 n=1 Tax=Agrocybe chaxingu TaxID=84603 RepID=A0A9W8K3Y4_9AGAR|nr:hypothetical protein NLJ89_g3461 [Agrocybe chaxingu]
MADIRQRTIIKVFRKFSNSLGPETITIIEKILDANEIDDADVESSIEMLAKEYNKQDDATMKVSKEVLQRVYESLQDQGERTQVEKEIIDPENHLFIIDAFEMPRWTWSQERGTFEKSSVPLTTSGSPESRVTSIRDRLNIIKQCVLRNEHFAPSTLPSRDREKLVTDEPGDGLFSEGCFALVEGEYTEEATLEIIAIGQPPCETRATARSIYGHIDFLGAGATSLLEDSQFEIQIREELPELHFFFLSDVWLDHPQTLSGIQKMFDNCIENEFIPKVIVMCGNFTSKSIAHGNGRDVQRYQDNFDSLADLIAAYPLITRSTHFVFVPGPLDITVNSTFPRRPLLSTLTGRLKSKVPKVHFATNPCRIKFFNQEIVIFREDLMARMLRNVVGVKPDVKSEDLKRFLVQSILDQSHLSPLTNNIQPVLSDHDHSLRLYPLPTALVLADKYDSYKVTYTGCHVFNPGRFIGRSLVFSTYTPAEVNSEEWFAWTLPHIDLTNIQGQSRKLLSYIHFVCLGSPDTSLPASILLWLVRIITFSLLLRTYLVPWFLALMSDRIRVRSISFRSIRGLYFRKGAHTWRVDRIGYVWSSGEGSRRLALKIDGLSLHVSKPEEKTAAPPPHRHNRNLTLADFNPSPLARRLWQIISAVTSLLEPYFRPIIRSYVIACLRVGIQWLPRIAQALSFDLHTIALTFADIPGAKINIAHIRLHTALTLTQLEGIVEDLVNDQLPARPDPRVGHGMGVWKKRLAEGFQRSLDKALGETRGTATLSLKISNINGVMPRSSKQDALSIPFLLSPGIIDLAISAKFNPKEGAIETHGLEVSLKIGDCSAKVDLLNQLLEKVSPKQPPPTINRSFASPSAPTNVQSFASSLFSPSSVFSPSGASSPKPSLFSPKPGQLLSPRSPKSPSSPFFQAISASMRPRRRQLIQPSVKLKDLKDESKLSILHNVTVSVASVGLSVLSHNETGPYKALISDISVDVSLSDPSRNDLHNEHLGTQTGVEICYSNGYALKLTLRQITLERDARPHTTRLARIGLVELQTLIFQWPAPFLFPSPFLRNDANASFLAVHLRFANIHLTDRLHDLQRVLDVLEKSDKKNKEASATPIPPSIPLPRLAISIEGGPIVAKVIYDSDKGERHRAIELRNNGFAVTLSSEYRHPSAAINRLFPAASSVQPLQWQCNLTVNLEPLLVRIRSKDSFISTGEPALRISDQDFLDDPPVLSIEGVEMSGVGKAIGQLDGLTTSAAFIDPTTLICDLSVAFDTVCVELWHSVSVDAMLRLVSMLPQKKASPQPPQAIAPQPRFSRLPIGLSFRTAISRLVVFITSPDISPTDNLELSRGFALRTSAALEYSSLHHNHVHWFESPQRIQQRAKLQLLPDTLPDALSAAKSFGAPSQKSGFLKMRLGGFVFKTAVATQFEPDDPAIVGREDPPNNPQEVLRMPSLQMDICLFSKPSDDLLGFSDICEVTAHIPSVHIKLQLAHAYSILLGFQTIRILNPPRPPDLQPVAKVKPNIVLRLQANITTIQALITLPSQKLVARLNGLSAHMKADTPPRVKLAKAAVFVALPSKTNSWEESSPGLWDEFVSLQTWEVTFTSLAGSMCISVDGDSARLRIPYGFVLADLIQDASLSAKAVKHMAHMAGAGCYSDMPPPEPEGPKSVPHLTVRLGYLCVEAQDDPFESKLALIWQVGAEAVKQRIDREEAFAAKVATILSAEPELQTETGVSKDQIAEQEYQFSAKHTIPIQEARRRLDDVHVLDWTMRLQRAREQRLRNHNFILHKLFGGSVPIASGTFPDFVKLPPPSSHPPLLRAMLKNLCLTISPPSFTLDRLPDVMHEFGSGLPRETAFSLLVPLHVHFTLSSLRVTLRDYPIPLASIPPRKDSKAVAWTFETDLIIGEEMGTDLSVDWVRCTVIEPHQALQGEAPFAIMVPKTIMPVKMYAAPIIKIAASDPTTLSWGVSYGPAIQDLMRVVDTLSSAPRDTSPSVGFWDKMRLVFHWTVKVTFASDVRLFMKGTRDPYNTIDAGTGFVLAWQGNPEIRVGYENYQKELIQVMSDDMVIGIPEYFSFRPHFDVKLERKSTRPEYKSSDDSFNGFRSDFIHLSVSLASSTKSKDLKGDPKSSNLYLTPKLFAHFWSWCSLFDGALTLPIRQGSYHPTRPISPKLGRHLSTLKYRISILHLYFVHGYIDDSRETWVDGVTPWVGMKGKVDELQADMHQREEESTVPGPIPNTSRTVRRKPFYAAELILKGLELRTMLATFSEPLKQNVQITSSPQRSNYRKHSNLPTIPSTSIWHDLDDFVELDWTSKDLPTLHLLPVVACPHFTYFKRNSDLSKSDTHSSKFGSEHSHICLLGKEPSVPRTQISLATARVDELKSLIDQEIASKTGKGPTRLMNKMVSLLEDYIAVLQEVEIKPDSSQDYHMPADIVSSDEWAEFDNVYQIHCPSIFMDAAVRDIVLQYYYCSRDRRGFEYHMATRAVKFIRDQANAAMILNSNDGDKDRVGTAQIAASALRKILKGDNNTKTSVDVIREKQPDVSEKIDPLDGWAEGVSLLKSHCFLLLKPQIVLRGDTPTDALIVAAAQSKLQSFSIMDLANLEDPVSGKVMSRFVNLDTSGVIIEFIPSQRNYTSLNGLQCFAPTGQGTAGDGSVPLEVLIDLRCESNAFERLVPQTDATFHYDKFNRLRLRNNVTSIVTKTSVHSQHNHLQDQTDLVRVHIPRFTVAANSEHFQAISNIVTKLVLFSDPAHKTRLDKLETLVFAYDFTDLASAAPVVSSLQSRLRDALETEKLTLRNLRRVEDEEKWIALLQLKAHIFLLSEELNLLFDAIKMAQDRFDDQADQKSALLLHASSSEISWRMLDSRKNLLSKLVVSKINFHWLSRQDSSTVNHLTIGNLTAFDGSRYAIWSEILSKHDEPSNHTLLKRGLFLLANWTILAPVGGITIYESFELTLHPLRLQVDAKVGRRIMEYFWPDRKARRVEDTPSPKTMPKTPLEIHIKSPTSPHGRSSIDSPRALYSPKRADSTGKNLAPPPLRKLGTSRSFTDLRTAKEGQIGGSIGFLSPPAFLKRTQSTDSVNFVSLLDVPPTPGSSSAFETEPLDPQDHIKDSGDAQVMKNRSSQKSFVLVRISSLHLLLSVVKEGSFECHDAKIKTRELEYRNQTWSFEELVNQFIPSNMNWRGWVKMAFHQPLIPVLPVARELLAKTKWTATKGTQPHDSPLKLLHPSMFVADDEHRLALIEKSEGFGKRSQDGPSRSLWKNPRRSKDTQDPPPPLTSLPLTSEPESMDSLDRPVSPHDRPTGRKRVKSLFSKSPRNRSKSKGPPPPKSEELLK